ncbi:helix-turn-helix transcriptional regulator [Pseudomonas sp. gcc21]|uniref:helix-turn-helix domain-containing protein n=1 Tax=Pseudomonas sp. gcc21 TaxID=2726989 RepID=UPI00145204FF|nr:helix-turn-helix transcriptional regulator [Pseudomonas sp. gcc21]QJD58164.1 helix-turn-helix transcriptional regulator [Pseudomonas sp. gcc21]
MLEQSIPASHLAATAELEALKQAFFAAGGRIEHTGVTVANIKPNSPSGLAAHQRHKARRDRYRAKVLEAFNNRLKLSEIAAHADCSRELAESILKEEGLNPTEHADKGPTPEQLAQLRKDAKAGITQRKAADALGVPRGTLSRWCKKYNLQFGRQPA